MSNDELKYSSNEEKLTQIKYLLHEWKRLENQYTALAKKVNELCCKLGLDKEIKTEPFDIERAYIDFRGQGQEQATNIVESTQKPDS